MARLFPPEYQPSTRGFPPRDPAKVENSGSSGVAGVSYKLVFTASGPVIAPVTFSGGTASVGSEIAPDQTGNNGVISSWSVGGYTATGAADNNLANNYWAAWEIDWLGDNLWNMNGSVDPNRAVWPADIRFGWGLFRSNSPGDFSWGGGFGIGGLNYVARCHDGSWNLSGFVTSQEECVGAVSMSNSDQRIRRISAFGTRSNGNDSSRSTFTDALDTNISNVSGQNTYLYLFISGAATIAANNFKAGVQIVGWQPL